MPSPLTFTLGCCLTETALSFDLSSLEDVLLGLRGFLEHHRVWVCEMDEARAQIKLWRSCAPARSAWQAKELDGYSAPQGFARFLLAPS